MHNSDVPDETSAISVRDLSVRYDQRGVLEQVSLSVQPGSVYVLLGRNGVGKTSLVRCLLGQQPPSAGEARLLGFDAWSNRPQLMRRVGVVAEETVAPRWMTVNKLHRFCEQLYRSWNRDAVEQRLASFDIPRDLPFGKLSRGQKGLVELTLALGHSPDLLVLDDPTLGLDAAARRAVLEEIVVELADRNTTVFLTTHDVASIEGLADHVGILHDRKLIVDESVESLKKRHAETSSALEDIFVAVTDRHLRVA